MTSCQEVDLISILGGRAPFFRIIDIGALFTSEGAEPYARLLVDPRTTVIGFEPITTECDALNRMFQPSRVFLPYAIGDGKKKPFYRCNHAMTSSLYRPDRAAMNPFQNLPEFCEVTGVSEVQTVRLDDIAQAREADYIKIDVQGAELEVLLSAEACLESVLAVQAEVEFVPIYEGQPLFADVDTALRSRGFLFHRFMNMEGRTLRGMPLADGPDTRSQLLWADAIYIRPMSWWNDLGSDRIIKLAVLLHVLYGSWDFCGRLLDIYDNREGTRFFSQYTDSLRPFE